MLKLGDKSGWLRWEVVHCRPVWAVMWVSTTDRARAQSLGAAAWMVG